MFVGGDQCASSDLIWYSVCTMDALPEIFSGRGSCIFHTPSHSGECSSDLTNQPHIQQGNVGEAGRVKEICVPTTLFSFFLIFSSCRVHKHVYMSSRICWGQITHQEGVKLLPRAVSPVPLLCTLPFVFVISSVVLAEFGTDVDARCTVPRQINQCAPTLCGKGPPSCGGPFLSQTCLVSMCLKYEGLMRAAGIKLSGAQCSTVRAV